MTGGPLGDLAKMIPAGLLGYGLYKSGAVDNLNDMFNPKKTITDKIVGALAPEEKNVNGVPPVITGDMSVPTSSQKNEVREALDALSTQNQPAPAKTIEEHVDDVIPTKVSSVTVSPDPFTKNTAQDMAALQVTQAAAPPPSNVGQGQMGKDSQGGGIDMGSIVKLLMAFA